MAKTRIQVVITDLDNTLYDWFHFWYHAFGTMLDRLVGESGVPREVLVREIKEVHERYQTVEYVFLLQELPSLRRKHPGMDLVEIYGEVIHAYRRARKEHLKLYPGVLETLQALRSEGVLLVGYTESTSFHSSSRVRALGLDGVLDELYSPPDHAFPEGLRREEIRMYPPEHYELERTVHRHTPLGEVKPNPALLLDIIGRTGRPLDRCIYIGDSLVKDVWMAQEAGVTDVHARYGTAHAREEYDLLRAVTHWTTEQVERERSASSRNVQPSFVLESGFGEILNFFEFSALDQRSLARVGC